MVYNVEASGKKWCKVGEKVVTTPSKAPLVVERMFLGEYQHTIDDKGRMTIPSRFRSELANGVVVTRGLDRCLFAFPQNEWEKFVQNLRQKSSLTHKTTRDFNRFLFSGAKDIIPDRQGRILLPTYLRQYAELDSEAIVIGADTRLEIWQPDRWYEVRDNVEENAELIAEQLANMGI